MKTLLNWILLIICLLIVGFGSFKAGEANYRKKLRGDAGLDSSVLIELQSLDSLHRAQAQMWEAKATIEESARIKDQKQYAIELAKLRKQPPKIVQVTEERLLECDSAMATGQSFQREVELQKMLIIELKEVAQVKQTRIDSLEFGLERAEQRNLDNAELLQKEKRFSSKETKKKVFWRTITIVLAIERIVSLI